MKSVNYNENICKTCVFEKYGNCWPTPSTVVTGYDDKGNGIFVDCNNYEKDEGQDSDYLKEYDKKYNS